MSLKETIRRVGAVQLDVDDATLIDQAIADAVGKLRLEFNEKLIQQGRQTDDQIDALDRKLAVVERTQYGIQQLLGKAAAYVGKERGRLPR